MDYELYEPEDFAADESYLRYYFKLNQADIDFWDNWIRNHPEKLDNIINADQFLAFLTYSLPKEEFEKEYLRLMKSISSPDRNAESAHLLEGEDPGSVEDNGDMGPNKGASIISGKRRTRQFVYSVAASLLIALISGAVYFFFTPSMVPNHALTAAAGVYEKRNSSDQPLHFQLEDGSAVILQPGSSLSYPTSFLKEKREVYLKGEAFFEVSKNAVRPFYVYYNNLVTHVLGTSFNVRTDKSKGLVEVSVRTGRVEVYERNSVGKTGKDNKGNGVILTPNQKVVYSEGTGRFDASLVDVPLPIQLSSQGKNDSLKAPRTYCNAVAMAEIISSLESAYGVEIEVEDDNINNCHFTGDISDMNLFVKLEIICQSLNASFEIKGAKIIIRGKGCK